MSLINDALKDLDARRSQELGPMQSQPVGVSDLDYGKGGVNSALRFKTLVIICFFVGLAALWMGVRLLGTDDFRSNSSTQLAIASAPATSPTEVLASSVSPSKEYLINQNLASLKDSTHLLNDNHSATSEVGDSRKVVQDEIASWLNAAEHAIKNKQLTTPVELSAWTYYQKVLNVDEQNEDALNGIAKICLLYTSPSPRDA